MRRRFALIDRDGTIIEDRDYIADPADVSLIPGAVAGLRELRNNGLGLVVISNQSGIGRGYMTAEDAKAVNDRFRSLLAAEGIAVDGIYICPHRPDEGCRCRKPAPGLVERAAAELAFDPKESFVIGDKSSDMALARRLGAVGILVRTGYGSAQESDACPDYAADDLAHASRIIAELIAGATP